MAEGGNQYVITIPTATFTIDSDQDDGSPGTLRNALTNATDGQIIQINAETITLMNEALPVPKKGVSIYGKCPDGKPQVHIQGSESVASGLVLQGGVFIYGVQLEQFTGMPLTANTTAYGVNTLKCMSIVK